MANNIDYSDYNARYEGRYGNIWNNTGKCVFCDLKDKYIIKEVNNVVLTVALFPYINGHLLIIPRRHVESYDDISKDEWLAMQDLFKTGIDLLKSSKVEIKDYWLLYRFSDGFKAGKTVSHTHAHIIPYTPELIQVKYQNITYRPIDLAGDLRGLLK